MSPLVTNILAPISALTASFSSSSAVSGEGSGPKEFIKGDTSCSESISFSTAASPAEAAPIIALAASSSARWTSACTCAARWTSDSSSFRCSTSSLVADSSVLRFFITLFSTAQSGPTPSDAFPTPVAVAETVAKQLLSKSWHAPCCPRIHSVFLQVHQAGVPGRSAGAAAFPTPVAVAATTGAVAATTGAVAVMGTFAQCLEYA